MQIRLRDTSFQFSFLITLHGWERQFSENLSGHFQSFPKKSSDRWLHGQWLFIIFWRFSENFRGLPDGHWIRILRLSNLLLRFPRTFEYFGESFHRIKNIFRLQTTSSIFCTCSWQDNAVEKAWKVPWILLVVNCRILDTVRWIQLIHEILFCFRIVKQFVSFSITR